MNQTRSSEENPNPQTGLELQKLRSLENRLLGMAHVSPELRTKIDSLLSRVITIEMQLNEGGPVNELEELEKAVSNLQKKQ